MSIGIQLAQNKSSALGPHESPHHASLGLGSETFEQCSVLKHERRFVTHQLNRSALTEPQLVALARELFPVYQSGFLLAPTTEEGQTLERFDDLITHLREAHRVTIARMADRSVAFLCSRTVATPLGQAHHLQGLVCHADVQGQGVADILLRRDISETEASFVFMHTQSVRMLKLFSRVALQSEEVAIKLAPFVNERELDGLVERRRYRGRCLYGDVARFASFALPGLNILEGDALFVAGKIGT